MNTTTKTLKAEAEEYAAEAYRLITSDPFAYGIDEPWASVAEWLEYEMNGDAGDQFRTKEERDAVWDALYDVASLPGLNRPFMPGAAEAVRNASDLHTLLSRLRIFEQALDRDEDAESELRSYGVDIHELPVFGGEAPKSTTDVWSWDEDNLLMGCGPFKDWEIVERPEVQS